MAVYVDDAYIQATVPNGSVRHTSQWCHLTADTKEELHAFAEALGLKRSYFQPGKPLGGKPSPFWHYDVTEGKRQQAVNQGAQEVAWRDMPAVCRARETAKAKAADSEARQQGQGRRLLITGSRTWTDEATIRRELTRRYEPGKVLVSGHSMVKGKSAGADWICECTWRELGGQVELHPVTQADWKQHGKRAPLERDTRMVRSHPDEVVAFIQDKSHGASFTADMAKLEGIPVERHDPSADNYDHRAGLLWQAGDLDKAAAVIARARQVYPHSPERERWNSREIRIRAEIDKKAEQQVLLSLSSADMEASR